MDKDKPTQVGRALQQLDIELIADNPLILVIEDEASLTTLLRYNLESHGFRVVSVELQRRR